MAAINKTKIKIINRLYEAGYTDEKAISKLKTKDILDLPDLTRAEMKMICELQEAIKDNRVFSFFVDGGKESADET